MEVAPVLIQATELILKVIGPPLFKQILSIKDYEEESDKFADTIGYVGALLTDTEGILFNGTDSEINAYNRLHIAYLDAQDFMDAVQTRRRMLEAEDMKMEQAEEDVRANAKGMQFVLAAIQNKLKSLAKKITRSLTLSTPIKVHKEIKKLRSQMDSILNDLQSFANWKHVSREATSTMHRETGSLHTVSAIIGRDIDERKITELLLGAHADEEHYVPVVSIVGTGGLGKTTVARLVFKDESRLNRSCNFDLRLWVSDSQKFDMGPLLQKILQCISPADSSLHNLTLLENLQNRLVKEIRGKKYLVVLDNVIDEDRGNWAALEVLLRYGAKGSRILVTTRSRKVGEVMSSDSMIYELGPLSPEDSWSLFEKTAFRKSTGDDLPKLVPIGKDIVQKCGGVPLAINSIGNRLVAQPERIWEQVRNRDLEVRGNTLSILRVSYDALESKLKECFRYCALLPKNSRIYKEMLINIWISNVYFESKSGERIEDVCEDIITTLYERCFLENWDDNCGDFKMHELNHDLAKEVSRQQMLVVDSDVMVLSGTLTLEKNIRHLSLTSDFDTLERISRIQLKGTQLRTLLNCDRFTWLFRNRWVTLLSADKILSNFQVLRMLDLRASNIDRLPDSIGKLIHLRYLDLSGNNFETLPDSIEKLWNLRSLLLTSCCGLIKLPIGIRKLINLVHLGLNGCISLTYMPSGMGGLKSLRILNMFVAGHFASSDCARLEDLEPLLELQGELTIKIHERSTLSEATGDGGDSLLGNKRLRKLELQWRTYRNVDIGEDLEILAQLKPHSDLNEFVLNGYGGLVFPSWSVDLACSLPNLAYIVIDYCTRCQHLPLFSKLVCLKHLYICNLWNLEYIEDDVPDGELFFPSLQHLRLDGLPKLKGWFRNSAIADEQQSRLPSFLHSVELFIQKCPNLRMASMPVLHVGEYSVKPGEDFSIPWGTWTWVSAALTVTLREDWLRWGKYLPQENDSVAVAPVSLNGGRFLTDDVQLYMSIPWERYLNGNTSSSLVINDLSFLSILPARTVEESFRQMSKFVTSLEICRLPLLKSFPKVLRYLTALRNIYIDDCKELTGEESEESHEHETEHSSKPSISTQGFQSLRRLILSSLPNLVTLPKEIQSSTSLQELDIRSCKKLKVFPRDIQEMINLEYLSLDDCNDWTTKSICAGIDMSNLVILKITGFAMENQCLLPFLNYRWLKHLTLCGMPSLEYIQESNSVALSFPSLRTIWLENLPNLRDWCREEQQFLRESFPLLSHILISHCGNFNVNSMLLSCIQVPIFDKFWPSNFLKPLESLSCALCTSDVSLFKTILLKLYLQGNPLHAVIGNYDMEEIWIELDLERVSSRLISLQIRGDRYLKTLPEGLNHLTALQKLTFTGYRSIEDILEKYKEEKQSDGAAPWRGLKSLTHLEFSDLPQMETLPHWIQYVSSLQELQISGSHSLMQQLPEWAHEIFDDVSLPGQRGLRLMRKRINGGSSSTVQPHQVTA